MSDINIRVAGHAGRITLTRPKALNALTYDMCLAIDAALKDWAGNDNVRLVVIDAEGEKAFCAGGDIAEMYYTGTKGNYDYGRKFWRDEYRMNARISEYPKPVVGFLQGFTMGGGVGVGCHGSHRVVGESSQISMPEAGIGLVPDVGGSLLLALAPGRLGEYLGITAARMNAGDAVFAGFADHFIPEDQWPALIAALEETGDAAQLEARVHTMASELADGAIDRLGSRCTPLGERALATPRVVAEGELQWLDIASDAAFDRIELALGGVVFGLCRAQGSDSDWLLWRIRGGVA